MLAIQMKLVGVQLTSYTTSAMIHRLMVKVAAAVKHPQTL
jgi:hypothetical protein